LNLVDRAWDLQHRVEGSIMCFFVFRVSRRFIMVLVVVSLLVLGVVELLYFDIVSSLYGVSLFELLFFDGSIPLFLNPVLSFFLVFVVYAIYKYDVN
jgi:hypothetical protein